jgi:outer membrane protein assembly factor BamB
MRGPLDSARVTPEVAPVQWPGFRGPRRDSAIPGVRIATDWRSTTPAEVWRQPVGPGWSSFAVAGGRIYTQEQRGDEESVTAYDLTTGEIVWRHRDAVRFWEANGGAGPRATPTVSGGRVYALGATGLLNVLDAASGARFWSRNAAEDAGVRVPYWGIAASPLVIGDLVVVAASGRLVAYDRATGEPRWFGPTGGGSYSSPHLVTIDGIAQIVLTRDGEAIAVAAADGAPLWRHAWAGGAIVQPAVTADGDLLISTNGMTGGNGIRRLAVSRGVGGWTVEERWTSSGLKPYFNDFVVHMGYAYGFDGRILSAIDLSDGARVWKNGRYGQGQLVLLRDQGLLLVISEDGELALVRAVPGGFTELARIPALDGKTWNHPVVVGNLLLVRNGQEMAAFRLPPDGPPTTR